MILGCWPTLTARSPPRSKDRQAVAGHAFRSLAHRARLGHDPGRQLRRRGRRTAAVAGSQPDLPRLRIVPGPIRVGREASRRQHQPGRQCAAAAGSDRPRDRVMAQRSGSSPLWPTAAGPRQEGRGDRLRDGAPRQQDRLRLGPGPDRLRPGSLGLTAARDSSIAAYFVARSSGQLGAPAAQRGRTRLTAASSGTQSGGEEALRKGADLTSSQPVLPVRGWTARRAGQTPI